MRKLSLLIVLLFLGFGGYFGLVAYKRAGEAQEHSSNLLVTIPLSNPTTAPLVDSPLPTQLPDESIAATPQPSISPSPSVTLSPVPSATPPPPPPVGQEGNWILLFNDEFDGHTLNASKWTTCYWWDDHGCTIITNDELEWYQPDNVQVNDGLLVLQATGQVVHASNGRYEYTSGMVSSSRWLMPVPAGFAFQYDTEMRVLIPAGKGLWPAF
jgi:hypothetical protein